METNKCLLFQLLPVVPRCFTTRCFLPASNIHCFRFPWYKQRSTSYWLPKKYKAAPLLVACQASHQNLYNILGVDPTSDISTIKRAYRKKALEFHPDVSKDPRAKERFVQILHAYQILSNEESRKRYDRELKRTFFGDWKGWQNTSRSSTNSSNSKESDDFMKEWRKKNPYPEDLNDDWSTLWNDITRGAKKAAEQWNMKRVEENKEGSSEERGASLVEDFLSFIQDQLIGLSAKEQEEDLEDILKSEDVGVIEKEMENRKFLVGELQKKLQYNQARFQVKEQIVKSLKSLKEYSDPYMAAAIKEELAGIQSQWIRNITNQLEREQKVIEQLAVTRQRTSKDTSQQVDKELAALKRQMGMDK
eukprot:jgi/Galph1/5870/GphlegSOOS_G4457.1